MYSSNTFKKVGRPQRHPVDVLRTKLWFHVLKLVSGLPSAYSIELKLEPESVKKNREGGVVRPRKWDAYEKGNRVPQRTANKPYSVDLAEALFPGAAAYFESPIWSVLRKETLSKDWIEAQLRQLSPAVTCILLSDDVLEFESERRFREFDQESANQLAKVGTFDALVAAILLVAKSELIASPDLRYFALKGYMGLLPALKQLAETAPFMRELSLMIDTTCKHWVFPTTQSRMDIVIFSD